MLHALMLEQCSIKENQGNGKLRRFIDSTFKSLLPLFFFLLSRTTHTCTYRICPRAYYRPNQHSYCTLSLPSMSIPACSELPEPSVPSVCLHAQRAPWAAVCLFSHGLVTTPMWLWLTARPTTSFMRHLLAVNQSGHPGAIDGAVSPCEMCLSNPTHPARAFWHWFTPSSFHSPFPCHFSLSFFQLFVRLSPASFPSETRRPPNPRSNHRFFGYTFVILRPSRLLQIVLYKHVCRWLGPDISVVFIASPCFYVYPLNANVTSRLFFLIFPPIKFLLRSLPPVPHLLLLLSPFSSVRDRWQGPWCFIEELSNLSIPSVPFQTSPDQTRPDYLV